MGEMSYVNSSAITIGAKNLTNEEPPWVPYITSYDPVNHDPRGRMWYVRVSASL
jgi:outer membrane receptor protein involved in Fe transport